MKQNNFYILRIVFIAAIGGFLLGFDNSVISGAIPFYKPIFGVQEGSFLLGFSVSCIIWGCLIGNLISGPISDKIGRKPSLLISAILFTASALLCAFAESIGVFIIGRIIGGFGVGIAILVAPVYIAEISPASKRGWLVSFNQLLIVIGLSAAYFSNYFILKAIVDPLTNWRWMLGIEALPAILYFIAIFFIPESPRWLVMKGQDEKALKILNRINGESNARNEYEEIKKSTLSENNMAVSDQLKKLFTRRMKHILIIGFGMGILQQFSGINAILYYAPMVFESAGGERDAAFLQTIVLGVVFVVMTIASMFFIDRLGRKPLLYIGVSIMALSLAVTGIVFKHVRYQISQQQIITSAESVYKNELWDEAKKEDPALIDFDELSITAEKAVFKKQNKIISSLSLDRQHINELKEIKNLFIKEASHLKDKSFNTEFEFIAAINNSLSVTNINSEHYKSFLLKEGTTVNVELILISILAFIAGFSISLGPVMWAMLSEIFPTIHRGLAISVVGAANALSSFIVATFFPMQLATLGSSSTFFIYAAFMFICLWFVWKYVVETKGKSLEQLEKELISS